MTRKQIDSIIKEYAGHDMPDNVRIKFGQWITDSDSRAEKDEALEELWNASDSAVPDNPTELWGRIKRNITEKRRRHTNLIGALIAAASLAVVLTAALAIQRSVLLSKNTGAQTLCMVTAQDSKGSFVLSDGTKVWLNGNSRLTCPDKFSGDTRSVTLEGEGYFEVAKDARHPFTVSMGNYNIEVLGTKFDVKSYGSLDYKEVVLCEGSVKVWSDNGFAPVMMTPGHMLTISCDDNSSSLDAVNTENYRRWINKTLRMDNMRLDDIIINLERWFNVEFDVSPTVNVSTRLSFNIRYESIEEVMRAMSLITPLKYGFDYDKNTVHIYAYKQK